MRVLLFTQVAAFALVVSGCPGAPASDPSGSTGGPGGSSGSSSGGEGGNVSTGGSGGSGNSGNSGTGGANTGGSGNGAGGSGTGGSGGGGDPKVCEPLLMDLTVKQESAQKCSFETAEDMRCLNIIEGLCCPIGVDNMNSPEAQAYLEALKAYLDAGCVPSCPPIPCPDSPGVACMAGMGSTSLCVIIP